MPDADHTDPRQRWTDRARIVATLAEQDARARGHQHVSPQHYLLALLTEGESVGPRVLRMIGVPVDRLCEELDRELGHADGPSSHAPAPTPQLERVLRMAQTEHAIMGVGYLGTEHLLLSLAADSSGSTGQTLTRWHATPDRIRAGIHELLTAFSHGCPPSREQHVEPSAGLPDEIRELGERVDRLRQQKELAIDSQDFEAAVEIRRAEKELLAQRAHRIREWSSQVDTVALAQEVVALQDQIRRFRQLAGAQGIDLTTGAHNAGPETEAPI